MWMCHLCNYSLHHRWTCLVTISAIAADALVTPPACLAPSSNTYHSSSILHSQNAKQQQHDVNQPSNDDGNDGNNLFNNVGNLINKFFHSSNDNAPNINLPNINLPNINLANLTSSLPNILPDILPSKHNDERYQNVNEFDVDLAKDIEEALQLANELASGRGLGDMAIGEEVTSNENVDGYYSSVQSKSSGSIHDGMSRGDKPGEAGVNAANWNRDGLKTQSQSRTSQPNNTSGNTRSVNRSHDNVRENKPSLFQETNAAADLIAMKKMNRESGDANSRENYMNAPDVKEFDLGTPRSSTRGDGVGTKKPKSFIDVAGVKTRTAGINKPTREGQTWRNSESERRVDATTAGAGDRSANTPPNTRSKPSLFFATSGETNMNDEGRQGYMPDQYSYSGHESRAMPTSQSRMQSNDASDIYERYKEYFEGNNTPDTYERYKEYFEGDGNEDINDASIECNPISNKIFITESAIELAQSLKLDVYEIFQYKKRELGMNEEESNVERAMVNEEDVRDYLDRRYEQLFSMVEKDDGRRGKQSMSSRRYSASVESSARRDDDYRERKEIRRRVNRARDLYYNHQSKNEDAHGWRMSRQSQLRQQSSQRSLQQREHRESINPQRNGMVPPISSVPLSQLVSNERSDRMERLAQYPPGPYDVSHLRQLQYPERQWEQDY